MKKFSIDKNYFKISTYVLIVIILAITFEKIIGNVDLVTGSINNFFNRITSILAPFLAGALIAYLLNSFVRTVETRLLSKIKYLDGKFKVKRYLAITVVYLLVLGFLVWIIAYLIPEIVGSIKTLIQSLQSLLNGTNFQRVENVDVVNSFIDIINSTLGTSYTVSEILSAILSPVVTIMSSLPDLLGKLYTSTMSFAYSLFNFSFGIVISVSLISGKERFSAATKKLLYTFLRPTFATKIINVSTSSNAVFEKFFVGKIIDSTIIGVLFFIAALIMKLPYAVLLSLVILISNMIPYFGPIIGAVPVVIIVMIFDFPLAIWTAVVVFVLQQFDGWILAPKILGDSTGLSPLGVLFAIIVGGALFGVPGMFFGVPTLAVINTIGSSIIDRKYKEKYRPVNVPDTLPNTQETKEDVTETPDPTVDGKNID